MDNKTKFSLFIIMSMAIYFILTFPMFIAFFSMDIETGNYVGIIYPQWLCITIAIISGIAGAEVAKHYIRKIEKKDEK